MSREEDEAAVGRPVGGENVPVGRRARTGFFVGWRIAIDNQQAGQRAGLFTDGKHDSFIVRMPGNKLTDKLRAGAHETELTVSADVRHSHKRIGSIADAHVGLSEDDLRIVRR